MRECDERVRSERDRGRWVGEFVEGFVGRSMVDVCGSAMMASGESVCRERDP